MIAVETCLLLDICLLCGRDRCLSTAVLDLLSIADEHSLCGEVIMLLLLALKTNMVKRGCEQ